MSKLNVLFNFYRRQTVSNASSSQLLSLSVFKIRVVFLLGIPPNDATSDELQYQINYEHDVYGKTATELIIYTSFN